MDDWQILWGKAVGVFRRCLPIWFLLAGHILLFVAIRYIHPIAIVHLLMILAGLVVFLTGAGLYFSTLLRRTTSSVVANFAFFTIIWIIVPLLLGLLMSITRGKREVIFEAYVSANPVVQVSIIMYGAGGDSNARMKLSDLDYNWPLSIRSERTYSTSIHSERTYSTTGILLITTLIYISVGVLFAWRAKCRFRRNVF
jgi:ABC-type transport system involved in multi-copper enzyme maturation permease subunit